MTAFVKNLVFAGLFVTALSLSATASAQNSAQIRLMPQPGFGQPRLGFNGHFEWGHGMVVDSVPWGTPAAQVGLESGDVIRAMNGRWLSSQDEYFWILRNSGGQVRLVIEDVNSGMLVTRTAFINSGPIPLMRTQRQVSIGNW